MRRRLLALFTVLSLALCIGLAVLRVRSADRTDVLMVAPPGGRCLLLTSHEGKWVVVSGLCGWTDRGLAAWSARRKFVRGTQSWNQAGPFLFWQRHTSSVRGEVWVVHDTLVVPTDDGGKLPAYGDGYARADAAGAWSGVLPGQKGWLFLSGWEVRVPHAYLIALTALPPLVIIPVWLMRQVRRLRRPGQGLCAGCGYDLRASADRCPECGRPIAPGAPPLSGTAPAATAP